MTALPYEKFFCILFFSPISWDFHNIWDWEDKKVKKLEETKIEIKKEGHVKQRENKSSQW